MRPLILQAPGLTVNIKLIEFILTFSEMRIDLYREI